MLNAGERKKQREGYEAAEKILKEEWELRLRKMTNEESFAIYSNLCEFYYSQHPLKKENTDKERLDFLLRRRAILNKLAEKTKK